MSDLPVMFTVPQVCRILQMSRSKVYEMLASGEVPSVLIGRSRRVPYDRFRDYLATL